MAKTFMATQTLLYYNNINNTFCPMNAIFLLSSCTLRTPLLFGSFGWGEILIIAFILMIVISIIVVSIIAILRSRSSTRRPNTYMDNQQQAGVADELAKLANLRDRGVITDEEFEEQKRIILKRG